MYRRFPRLLEEIQIARGDGSLPKLPTTMNKARLLILDDLGLSALSTVNRQDLLDLVDDRTGSLSIAVTSQLPIDKWHEYLEVPTIADAVTDRIVHSAHRMGITRESPRKLRNPVKNMLGATHEQ